MKPIVSNIKINRVTPNRRAIKVLQPITANRIDISLKIKEFTLGSRVNPMFCVQSTWKLTLDYRLTAFGRNLARPARAHTRLRLQLLTKGYIIEPVKSVQMTVISNGDHYGHLS